MGFLLFQDPSMCPEDSRFCTLSVCDIGRSRCTFRNSVPHRSFKLFAITGGPFADSADLYLPCGWFGFRVIPGTISGKRGRFVITWRATGFRSVCTHSLVALARIPVLHTRIQRAIARREGRVSKRGLSLMPCGVMNQVRIPHSGRKSRSR